MAYKGALAKLRSKKRFHQFLFYESMFGATRANACSFLPAFIHIFWMCNPKLAFHQKITPSNFSLREVFMTTFPTFIALSSLPLNNT